MSNYSGRHGPDVSQYLRDLNTISPQDAAAVEPFNDEALAIFTNTQFFDFDSGQNTDFQAEPAKAGDKAPRNGTSSEDVSAAPSVIGEMPNLDFMSDFSFSEFSSNNGNGDSNNNNNNNNNATYAVPHMTDFSEQSFQPLQPNNRHVSLSAHHAFPQATAPRVGEKRKSDVLSQEEAARVAAEEDKRRRNTAASARFRIKKKQREQALEKSAKEMTDKVTDLENRVSQLETENKWLKNLLVEKNEGSDDIVALWKEFAKHASDKAKAATSGEKVKATTSSESSSSEKLKVER